MKGLETEPETLLENTELNIFCILAGNTLDIQSPDTTSRKWRKVFFDS